MSYRRFRLLLILGAISSLVLAACGGGEEEAAPQPTMPVAATAAPAATTAPVAQPTATPQPTAAPPPTATAAPVSSGQLTVTLETLADFGLVPFPNVIGTPYAYIAAMYDSIIGIGPDRSPDPAKLDFASGFATSLAVNGDGTVWTIKVRNNLVFQNGDKATAKDAAYTSGLNLTEDNRNTRGFDLQKLLTKIETPDDQTVVYTLNRTSIFFPSSFLSFSGGSVTLSVLPQK